MATDGSLARMRAVAFVTGIGGQDGHYLTELLLAKHYEVHGLDRDAAALDCLKRCMGPDRLKSVHLYQTDVADEEDVLRLLRLARPAEVYNLAAQTRVDRSFIEPTRTARGIVIGTSNVLEAVRNADFDCRVFQASSSEMFGNSQPPQSETTTLRPISPYAHAKVHAHRLTGMYRELFGMHASAGILFNHESPRRSRDFVSRRITSGIAEILAGERGVLTLGNVEAKRDWGHARDYVRAMWLMVQSDRPADYVIASGTSRSVADFARLAFSIAGLDWQDFVVTDDSLLRPTDPGHLEGEASRARTALAWRPRISFEDLVREMLMEDLMEKGVPAAHLVSRSPLH